MVRVHVICEGQTEETFVNEVLRVPLRQRGVELHPSLVGKPGKKGGALQPARLIFDIRNRLLGDKTAYCTTLFDFYRLPAGDFPGRTEAMARSNSTDKATCLLEKISAAVRRDVGDDAMRRFIPYVQMHEFEGLLFSNATSFARAIGQEDIAVPFQRIRDAFASPEDINDDAASAPSKRISNLFPSYEKPISGSLAAMEIGLATIRSECPQFHVWLTRLEALTNP